MLIFISVLIAIIAVLLIAAVLIQNPKGGGIDSTYGSGANQMFGASRSADAIEKITWYLAGALIVMCIISYFFISSGAAAGAGKLLSQ
jgi:preprotein translocase subunit SecG